MLHELHGREVKCRSEHMLWFDAPAMASDTARLIAQRRDAVKSRELHFHLGAMDEEKNLPTLSGKPKIDWPDFPVDDILQQFTTLKEGILRGVFKQKQLVRGSGAVQKKLKLLSFSRAAVVRVSGRKRWIACPIVGRSASTLAGCSWVRCKQTPFTCTASLQGLGTCGSH